MESENTHPKTKWPHLADENANLMFIGDDFERKAARFSTETILTHLYGKNTVNIVNIENEKARGKRLETGELDTAERWMTYAIKSFPAEVQLCTSSIPGARFGVCAKKTIPEGTWIGPFEGNRRNMDELRKCNDTTYTWEVYSEGQPTCYIDGSDENTSSWMRFIRCARYAGEQNLFAFQYMGNIFYRAFKEIPEGTEMLVWYDEKYPQYLGIPTGLQEIEFVTTAGEVTGSPHSNISNNGQPNGKLVHVHVQSQNHGQQSEPNAPGGYRHHVHQHHPNEYRRDNNSIPPSEFLLTPYSVAQSAPGIPASQQSQAHTVTSSNNEVVSNQVFPPQLVVVSPPQAVVKPLSTPRNSFTSLQDSKVPDASPSVTSVHDNRGMLREESLVPSRPGAPPANISAGVPPQNMMGSVMGRVHPRSRSVPALMHNDIPKNFPDPAYQGLGVPQGNSLGPMKHMREQYHASRIGRGRHAGLPTSPYARSKEALTRKYSGPPSHSVGMLLGKSLDGSSHSPPSLKMDRKPPELPFGHPPQLSHQNIEGSGLPLNLRLSPPSSQHSMMVSGSPYSVDTSRASSISPEIKSPGAESGPKSPSLSPRKHTPLSGQRSSSSSGSSIGHAHLEDYDHESRSDAGSTGSKDDRNLADEISMWKCKQCQKTFTQRVLLQVHVCPRQPNKPYQCGQCELSFGSSRELRNHVDTHASEKPFKCGFCSRSFAGATTLNNHIRTHMGKRPFACERCGKNFSQAGQLARHHRTPEDCIPSPMTSQKS